jgi:diguanylate cyclase
MGALELSTRQASYPVAQELRYLRDDSGRLQLADVLAPSADWQRNDAEVFNRGYNSATWWLRFDARNADPQQLRQLIEIAYPVLDEVEVWILHEGKPRAHYQLGDKRPFHERPIDHRFFLIPLNLDAGETDTVVLRVKTSSSVQVPLTLWNERDYFDHDLLRMLGQGFYFGTMMVMVLYNLFIFLIVGDRNYLYYVLYVVCMPLFLASLGGLAFQYLWPEATTWNDQAIVVSLCGVVIFGCLFTNRFLLLRQNLPSQMSLFILGLAGASVLITLASFFLPYALMIHLAIVVATLACMTGLVSSMLRWRQGDSTARFYTIAWSSMLFGGIVLALNKFHLLPQNVLTENATQVGSAIEVILLSFALAERINQEKRLRFEAQQEALKSERVAREAQAGALAVQRLANETLEQRVQERTLALEEANRKLAELGATDQLTGLRNRRFLDTMLSEEVARCYRYRHTIAVLLIDIDHFKRFNDTYGHLVGDDCLRHVAGALREAVRWPTDKAARYGGEEFCVVLPETDAEGARIVGERIRQAVEALVFEVTGQRVPITVSVGVAAVVPDDANAGHLLISAADRALYRSKALGRNCVTVAADGAPDAEVAPAEA